MEKRRDTMRMVLAAWLAVATIYVFYDIWTDFKVKQLQAALQSGKQETINDLISKIKSSECQPLDVYNDREGIKIIDFTCVNEPSVDDDGQLK